MGFGLNNKSLSIYIDVHNVTLKVFARCANTKHERVTPSASFAICRLRQSGGIVVAATDVLSMYDGPTIPIANEQSHMQLSVAGFCANANQPERPATAA